MIVCAEACIIISKHTLRILPLVLSLLLSACSLRLHEEPVKFNSATVSPVQNGCLTNSGTVLQRYFDGNVEEQELAMYWDCLHKAFDLFVNNTTGAHPDYYTPAELTGFLKTYFLKGTTIPDGFTHEAMVLKQAIIGGTTEKLTRDELNTTLNLILAFRTSTLQMRPYLPLTITAMKNQQISQDKLEAAISTLHGSMELLGTTLEKSAGTYSFDYLNNLLVEMEKFLRILGAENTSWTKTARDYIKILRSVKSILISPPENSILASDYAKIFHLAPRYFTLYLRSAYYFSDSDKHPVFFGTGLNYLINFASEVQETLLKSMSYHPNNTISIQEFYSLIDALDEQKMLPATAQTIKDFVSVLAFRLQPNINVDPTIKTGTFGISDYSIKYLWNEFSFWSEGQSYLNGAFAELTKSAEPQDRSLNKIELLTVFPNEALKWTRYKNQMSLASISDLQRIVTDIKPVLPEHSSIVEINYKQFQPYTFEHLSRLNWLRSLGRIVGTTYASDVNRARNLTGLTKDEVTAFYRDVFPLAVELKLLSAESKDAAGSRFFEANLFLYSSDGNDLLSMNETLELGTIGVSTLIKASDNHKRIAALCKTQTNDERGIPSIDTACYRTEFLKNIDQYWSHIPAFVAFVKQLPTNSRGDNDDNSLTQNELFNTLNALIRTKPDRKSQQDVSIEQGESQGLVLTSYYIEILFSHFDANRHGTLNYSDTMNAYPIFRNFIATKASAFGLNSEEDYKAVFSYIMKYGSLPNESVIDKARYFSWRYISHSDFRVNRADILKIFGKLLNM